MILSNLLVVVTIATPAPCIAASEVLPTIFGPPETPAPICSSVFPIFSGCTSTRPTSCSPLSASTALAALMPMGPRPMMMTRIMPRFLPPPPPQSNQSGENDDQRDRHNLPYGPRARGKIFVRDIVAAMRTDFRQLTHRFMAERAGDFFWIVVFVLVRRIG